jgi:hypothetical protein
MATGKFMVASHCHEFVEKYLRPPDLLHQVTAAKRLPLLRRA